VRPARYSSRRELRRLAEFAQELLRILQIAGVEALCEPTVPKREQLAGFGPSACSPKAALGSSQAQFEGLCLPLARLVKALARMRLSVLCTPCTRSLDLSTSDDVSSTTADLHETRRNGRRSARPGGERHFLRLPRVLPAPGSSTAATTPGLR